MFFKDPSLFFPVGENLDTFQKTIKEAEDDFKKIENQKSKVKILNDLNQDMPGTVECFFLFEQFY